jgi:hypothetical protein
MKPSQVLEAMAVSYKNNGPRIILIGSPGTAKTSLVNQLPAYMKKPNLPVYTFQATLYAPDEVKGLPTLVTKSDGRQEAVFLPFQDMPSAPEGILNIDDLPHAPTATQNAFMRLILENICGAWNLGGIRPFATGNRSSDRAGAKDLQSAMANRFTRIEVDINYEDWRSWAIGQNIRPEIISFLGAPYGAEWLNNDKFDPGRQVNPTPRSWEFASRWFEAFKGQGEVLHECLNGCIGGAATSKFMGWLKVYSELPDLNLIMQGAKTYPEKLDIFYACISGLVQLARNSTKRAQAFQTLVDYATTIPDKYIEMGAMLSKDLFLLDEKVFTKCNISKWQNRYEDVIL